ncbi:MAG: mechanosensitive ion channel domain-containing protein [Cyanobacteriota bacterium]|nr:mechanosensitive ion channel domain-containing protein [Cyanobacteriota bacterium]
MTQAIVIEVLGWFAFLQRADVLLQLLLLALLMLAVQQGRRLVPRTPRALPGRLLLLGGEVLITGLLALLGFRHGLVLLAAQITLAWVVLRLLEGRLLSLWLPPAGRRVLVSRLLRPIFLLGVLLVLLDALGSLPVIADQSLGVWFGSRISVGRLFHVLVVLYLLLVALELPTRAAGLVAQRGLAISEGSRRALEQILRYVLVALGVIWATAHLGINQTGVLAIAGGLSVGLGFGIKEVVSNIVSGLWLLIEGSVRPGEVLLHGGDVCEVRRLGPRATTLWRSRDNAELVVPNQDFFTTATTTFTGTDRVLRCRIELGVPRCWRPDQIMPLLEEIARGVEGVMADPPPKARLTAFGPQTYTYRISYAIADPLISGRVDAALRLGLCRRFADLGIDGPL